MGLFPQKQQAAEGMESRPKSCAGALQEEAAAQQRAPHNTDLEKKKLTSTIKKIVNYEVVI